MFIPSLDLGGRPLPLLAGCCRGLFLCDAEALACGLLGELLVKVVVFLFKSGGIEAIGEYRSPAHDVSTGFQFFQNEVGGAV